MLGVSVEVGEKIAMFCAALYVTVPGTAAELDVTFSVTLVVVLLIVVGSIGSLNVTYTLVFGGAVVPLAGDTETIVGAVLSGAGCVVNVDVKGAASELPATSLTPVETVTV